MKLKLCIHRSVSQNHYGVYCRRCREYVVTGRSGIRKARKSEVMIDDIVYQIPYRVWIMLSEQDAKIKSLEEARTQKPARKIITVSGIPPRGGIRN